MLPAIDFMAFPIEARSKNLPGNNGVRISICNKAK